MNEIIKQLGSLLSPILDRSGAILYSAGSTLKPGPVYLMGLNPGGQSEPWQPTIRDRLHVMMDNQCNAYLDEIWSNAGPGFHPLQKHLRGLFDAIGVSLRETCATSLIFTRSSAKDDPGYPGMADVCWPVHELLLGIVKPKAIIAFGNGEISPYAYIKSRHISSAGSEPEEEVVPAGHGGWSCCSFEAVVAGRKVKVIGVPHLSRYAIDRHADVLRWVKKKICNE